MHNKGARYSAMLHGLLLVFLIFGLPDFLHKDPDPEPLAISVDILPVAPISNVKPHETPPEKVEEKKPVAEEKTTPKEVPATKQEAPAPVEPEPTPLPAKEIIKKEEKKKPEPKKKPKPKEDDLSKILQSVKDQAKSEESKKPAEKAVQPDTSHEAKSDHYDPTMQLSLSERDALIGIIRQQVSEKWNPPIGARDANNLKLNLHITVSPDGTVTNVELAGNTSRYNSDSFFRAAADTAIRAVKEASPLKNLPADKYGAWQDLTFTFDPKDL